MDIRFLPISAIRTKKHIEEIKSKLSEEKREIILDIKNQLFSHPKYVSKELSSMDIYKAVLEDNVKNIEEFKNYFYKKSGMNL